jgi:hypothetical protein
MNTTQIYTLSFTHVIENNIGSEDSNLIQNLLSDFFYS